MNERNTNSRVTIVDELGEPDMFDLDQWIGQENMRFIPSKYINDSNSAILNGYFNHANKRGHTLILPDFDVAVYPDLARIVARIFATRGIEVPEPWVKLHPMGCLFVGELVVGERKTRPLQRDSIPQYEAGSTASADSFTRMPWGTVLTNPEQFLQGYYFKREWLSVKFEEKRHRNW